MATRAQIVMQQESVQRCFIWSISMDMNGLVLGRAKQSSNAKAQPDVARVLRQVRADERSDGAFGAAPASLQGEWEIVAGHPLTKAQHAAHRRAC
jgi:hypothetical protein